MRADTKIIFVKEGKKTYDKETGNYKVGEAERTEKEALVSDMQKETQTMLFGKSVAGALTVRLNFIYEKPFDYMIIFGKKYKVAKKRKLRHKQTFEVIYHESEN